MAEKLTMKILATELEALRNRVRELEQQLEHRLETRLEKVVERLKARSEETHAVTTGTPRHGTGVDAEHRQRMIAEAAYLRAERRGFAGGDPARDWMEAEQEIDRLLLEGKPDKPVKRTPKASSKRRGQQNPASP